MKHISFRLLIGLITFALGVVSVTLWLIYQPSPTEKIEEPPCKTCAAIYSISAGLPTLSFCEMVNRSENYYKVVRVRATFGNDAGQLSMYDRNCEGNGIVAEFADDYQSCDGAREALSKYSGWGALDFDGHSEVVVVGRYGPLNDTGSPNYKGWGFKIMCLEEASPGLPQ